ncbi:hypothetical protein PG996_008439 [Apiospora saccharicola]|uniref:2EXR domain-containing protein n=1 Tax=Apiospora saccharicola TaxID=335842 RepID=A0ABR1UYL5_9PEZI
MKTFPQFTRLAPELRQMIWDSALENEAENRIVLVHRASLRVVPSKCLISPLKSANKESRERALKHYNVKMDIGVFPAPLVVKSRRMTTWDHHVNSTEDAERLLNGRSNGNSKGCVYVNLGTDRFLLSFSYSVVDCVTSLFSYDKVAEGPGSTVVYQMRQACVGPKLSPAYCSMITNVVYKRNHHDYHVKPWPGKICYPLPTVQGLWMITRFPKLSVPTADAKFLTLDNGDRNGIIHLLLHEGAKSLKFTEWQTENDNKHGWRVWQPVSPKSG